jgi:hypothetical protein
MSTKKKLLEAAAGNAGGGPVYVDDVFSTYLYRGDGSARTVVNDIDLDGEGGLVWFKNREDGTRSHSLFDTETDPTGQYYLISNTTGALNNTGASQLTYNSDGFTIANGFQWNGNGNDMVSWTFRKQPGFFDVVTYTGDGTNNRQIPHSLGSTPGMVICKGLDVVSTWAVKHRSMPTNEGQLNSNAAFNAFGNFPSSYSGFTDSVFTVNAGGSTNVNGYQYVAYLFAHDAQEFGTDGDESIIKCGSYTGNGNNDGPESDLGWEPQYLLVKSVTEGTSLWFTFDEMRGFNASVEDFFLAADESTAERSFNSGYLGVDFGEPTATGFKIKCSSANVNAVNETYIYMAIRRPHKPASEFAATDLFNTVQGASSTANPGFNLGIAPDMAWEKLRNGSGGNYIGSRMTGTNYMFTDSNAAEAQSSAITWDYMNGWVDYFSGMDGYNAWGFKRAPGFFDVVAYTGDGTSGRAISHNLRVVPEMIWLKNRSDAGGGANWTVALSTTAPSEGALNNNNGFAAYGNVTAFATSTFTLLNGAQEINQSSKNYIAYLFATVAGISKVGSYTGTGNDLNVDCGFSAGARFILIKRTDATGDWYYWDSLRGIVAGNDPYLLLNTTAAQVTNTDYIDPLASGFTVTSSAPAALNASGGTYIFLAIA